MQLLLRFPAAQSQGFAFEMQRLGRLRGLRLGRIPLELSSVRYSPRASPCCMFATYYEGLRHWQCANNTIIKGNRCRLE